MELRNQNDIRYKIDYSKKVFVYKNLHRDCWSIKQGGLVKAHTTEVELWDCAFQVNARGRKKVLEEKRKNVHAGIKGYIDETALARPSLYDNSVEVTYNPYKYETFVMKSSEAPVYNSHSVKLSHNKVLAYMP